MLGGMNRRHFLKDAAGASAVAVSGGTFLAGLRAAQDTLKKENKSVIILWLGGGYSHLDTFDPHPGEPTGGTFEAIKTKADRIQVTEVLPTVAEQMQHLSIVRSLVTNEGSHQPGTRLVNTGQMPNPVVQYPALGSVASSLLTPKHLPLPGFIRL